MSMPPLVLYIFGGWNLGISADLVLQGVLFAQFAHYTTLYRKDIAALRVFVAVLLLVTTLKSAQGLAILWIQNVRHFTDIAAAAGDSWTSQINLALVALIAFYVQLFFCQRLWAISKNIYVVASIVALFVFALLAAFISTAKNFQQVAGNSIWIAVHLGTVFAGDLLLCGSTVFFLTNHSKQALPQTAGMLNAILKLTFQSAAPAAVCALINLVCSTSGSKDATANVSSMLAIISNNILPKLYAISAMWTLNSRKNIRLVRSAGQTTSSTEATSGRRRNNVELGALSVSGQRGAIQVRTQVQTTQHADDMFSPKYPTDFASEQDERSSKN
ncbi:hypothetical protein DFH09DRAFT_1413052 [Mycena vulgaris]|nr:hypothetical protein DFH09DRAFT_1413052 [Mycena vulgaris]